MIKTKKYISLLLLFLISGCTSIHNTKASIQRDKIKGNNLYNRIQNPRYTNYISFSDKPFLAAKTFIVANQNKPLPTLFNQNISISTNTRKTFEGQVLGLERLSDLDIYITEDASDKISKNDSQNKLAISYLGTLKGYLDQLTNQFGLFWEYDYLSRKVIIFYTKTRTFKLVIPESEISNFTSISNSNSNNKSSISYSTVASNAFQDAINTIKSFSKDIQIRANKSYAMITVTATPRVIEKVQDYINKFNDEAKKGVEVKISIYEVKTNRATNYGIDWNLIYNSTNNSIGWDTQGLRNGLSSGITTATVKAGITAGAWTGSNIIASALQKYLDATYVQGFSFYSLNGQTTPLNNGKSDSYVKDLAVTTLGANSVISGNNIKTSVKQSTINTGFTGSVLTNVIGDKVFLRMSLNMSKLTRLERVDYGDKKHPSVIQLPHTESNKIIQNIILKSGQTAVITGFSNNNNQLGATSLGDKKWWWFGGNQGTESSREILVVIVSAYGIEGGDHV